MGQASNGAVKLWSFAVDKIRSKSEPLYRQWFSRIVPLALADKCLTLGVPDDFFGEMLTDNYGDLLLESLSNIAGADYTYILESGHEAVMESASQVISETISAKSDTHALPQPAATAEQSVFIRAKRIGPDYRFDNFIVGDENRIAYAAAKAAAEEPGMVYNPLFIYGSNGVGKTHLLQSIAGTIRKNNPQMVIRNTTSDELINEFYHLVVNHKDIGGFRTAIRDVDVLLVDDIHRLAKKTAMQEEFFNVFNTLYQQSKQIVFTSDRQPCEISDLDKRLSTRFEQGMVSEVGMPAFEERLIILRMWRDEMVSQTPLADEFLEFLADHIGSSVRRLKSSFLRLTSFSALSGEHLTLERVEDLLHAQLKDERHDLQPEDIQRAVANHFGITIADILGVKRTKQIAEPRMVAMSLCRELTKLSSTELGAVFGRTHATILHAETQVEELCKGSENMRRSLNQLRRQLQKH